MSYLPGYFLNHCTKYSIAVGTLAARTSVCFRGIDRLCRVDQSAKWKHQVFCLSFFFSGKIKIAKRKKIGLSPYHCLEEQIFEYLYFLHHLLNYSLLKSINSSLVSSIRTWERCISKIWVGEKVTCPARKNVTICSVEVIKKKPPLSAKHRIHCHKSIAEVIEKIITNGWDLSKVGKVQSRNDEKYIHLPSTLYDHHLIQNDNI